MKNLFKTHPTKSHNIPSNPTIISILCLSYNIRYHLLKGIEIALPEDDLIQEFTEQVKSYFDKVKANQLQIQTLENLRDTLLPKLMSGEVRVQYQTEEVA